MPKNLQREFDKDAKSGLSKPGVKDMIDLYSKARDVRRSSPDNVEDQWERLVDYYNSTFSYASRFGDGSTNSARINRLSGGYQGQFQVQGKLMFEAQKAIVRNMRRPDRRFLSNDMSDRNLQITKDAVDTVQEKGGLYEALTEHWGIFNRFVGLGDAFVRMGFSREDDIDNAPVKYTIANLSNVYVDPFATTMRNATGQGAAGKMLVIEEMSYDKAKLLFPDVKFFAGSLPLTQDMYDQFDKSDAQQSVIEQRKVEIGYYYNIEAEKPFYGIYAGRAGTPILEVEGNKYPFFKDEKPFIPVVHFKCFPKPQGFYSAGVWSLLYDWALVQQQMYNSALKQIEDNINPLVFMSVQGRASAIKEQVLTARQARRLGEKAFIIDEVREGGSTNRATLNQLKTDPLTNEFERMNNVLTSELRRMGIPVDDINRPASQKATTTLAEEAAKSSFIQDIIETNTKAFEELDELTLAMIETLGVDNEMKVVTKVKGLEGTAFTLGDVVDEITGKEIQVDVEARTGAYKTPAFQILAANEGLQLSQGTPLQNKMLVEGLQLRGFNVSEEDLQLEQANAEVSPAEVPEGGEPLTQQGQLQELIAAQQPR